MTKQRFERYLLDGGMWFEEYIEPVWSIHDQKYDIIPATSPVEFLEFQDDYKDLCDEVVDFLNDLWEEREGLKELGKTVTTQRTRLFNYLKKEHNMSTEDIKKIMNDNKYLGDDEICD